MMHAALYARYSSDRQKPCSIDDQVRLCEARVERERGRVVTTYHDAAQSGFGVAHRAGYQALLADARQTPPPFDTIIVEHTDRLTRDNVELQRLCRWLRLKGIRLISVSNGIDTGQPGSKIPLMMSGFVSELFLDDLAAKTHRGLSGRVARGLSAGGRCFGFRAVPRGFEIEAREAGVVRRIFDAYANGRSLKAIAHKLNAEGVPSPTGRGWGATTLRLMLRNERYRGVLVWNRTQFVKDPDSGRRRAVPRPAAEWVRQPCPELRILEEDRWLAVQRRLAFVREAFGSGRPHGRASVAYSPTLLSGALACGPCGAAMIGQAVTRKTGATLSRYAYYRCGTAAAKGSAVCSHGVGYRQDRLEAAILSEFRRAMTPPMIERLTMMVNTHIDILSRRQDARVGESQGEILQLEREARNLLTFLRDGRDSTLVRDELARIEAALTALRLEQATLHSASPVPPPKVHPAWVRARLEQLDELLHSDPDRARAEILKHLAGVLTITPLPPAGRERRAAISGTIAPDGLLALGTSRDAKFAAGYSAGACNHRNRTT